MSEQPVALVTGAGRGIGRATAVELSNRGFAVVVCARTRTELEETAELCGGDALVVPTDAGETASIDAAVEAAVEGFGRLDALVNNAAVAPMLPITETDDATIDRVLSVNIAGPLRFVRASWPHLAKRGGTIVNVSSTAARDPLPNFAAYAASKGAINLMTLALAREGKDVGVRCHAVAPGAVETKMLRSIIDEATIPPEQSLDPADVATVIADCIDGPLVHANGECVYINK